MDKNEQQNEHEKNTNEESVNTGNASENEQQENANNDVQSQAESQLKIAELEAQVKDLNDKYLRLYSEFDNFRKRTAKERIELSKTAGEDIFKSILPIIDDFERAIKSTKDTDDAQALKEGVALIYNKFRNSLTQKGLEPMESIGKEFDPEVHEAITNIPAPSEDQKGKVVDEVERGYLLNGKIIRFAKVIVGS